MTLIQDIENHSLYGYVEAARRIGSSFRLAAEMRGVANVAKEDPLMEFKNDQYIQLELLYYF